jgi:hypothetical protein
MQNSSQTVIEAMPTARRRTDLKPKIPARFNPRMKELVRKAHATGVTHARVRLCAWLLVVAQNRPESEFPRGKNVPIPNYSFVGALHGIDDGDEYPEEVARRYAQGRKACKRVQAAAKDAVTELERVIQENLPALPVSTREDATHVLSALEQFVFYADPGEDLLKRTRAKHEHEAYSANSLALIWWRYYLGSLRKQYWNDMFSLARVWGVTSAANLPSFMRLVRELTESKNRPPPPFVSGA